MVRQVPIPLTASRTSYGMPYEWNESALTMSGCKIQTEIIVLGQFYGYNGGGKVILKRDKYVGR